MSDDVLREMADLVFGGGDELVFKMGPTQSDLATHQDRKKRMLTAGLSAVGATAGAAGLGYAAHKTGGAYRAARVGVEGVKAAKGVKGVKGVPGVGRRAAALRAVKEEPVGSALVPLEVAGLGGEVMATRILHGDTKKKQTVAKAEETETLLNNANEIPKTKGQLTRAVLTNPKVKSRGMEVTRKGVGALKKLPAKVTTHNEVEKALKTRSRAESIAGHAAIGAGATALPATLATWNRSSKAHAAALAGGALVGAGYGALKPVTHPKGKVKKRDDEIDVIWDAEISKVNDDKQQVFGWASVVEVNGEPVVDLQGDYISTEEMEKAGYQYVMKSRKGGDMHLRDNWAPIQKSEMIESFIVTPEKRDAMGLPDSVPSGWWVGFQIQDQENWADIKSGKRTGFSIHGHGRRT